MEHERPEAADGAMVAGLQHDGAHRIGVAEDGGVDAHVVVVPHPIDELHHRQAVTERAAARVDIERDGLIGLPFAGQGHEQEAAKEVLGVRRVDVGDEVDAGGLEGQASTLCLLEQGAEIGHVHALAS